MKDANLPAGIILAGGRSRRMPGQTKALAILRGRPLMQHVIDRMRPQVSSLAISVDQQNPDFERFGLRQVADPREGSCGPLGGLLAALDSLPAAGDRLLLAPCDAPFLPMDLGQRLADQLALGDLPACLVRYEHELQPTFSLWQRRLLPALRRAVLDEHLGGFKQFLARVPVSILDWKPCAVSPFFNINTPEDLAQADSLLESGLFAQERTPYYGDGS